MTNTQPRDSEGKYLTDKFDRPCRCGHTLGQHTAERAKVDGVWFQECVAGDEGGEACDCRCFKKVRARKPR